MTLRQLLDWQREAPDPSESLDALRFDLPSQEVYVFTPKGDVVPLPAGSTPSTSRTRCTPRSGHHPLIKQKRAFRGVWLPAGRGQREA